MPLESSAVLPAAERTPLGIKVAEILRKAPRPGARWDTLMVLAAVFGVMFAMLQDFRHVDSLEYAACDFKTLHAASVLLREGQNPYDPASIAAIYIRDQVVQPKTWFGHMPVYPPLTLQVLEPLSWLPMATASRLWFALSLLATGVAFCLLLALARRCRLDWPWRVGLLAACAGAPLLAFGLDVGNVSVVVAALTTSAMVLVVGDRSGQWGGLWPSGMIVWPSAVALALAFCLKPHIAVWVIAGLFVWAGRPGRIVAWRASILSVVASLMSLAWLAGEGRLGATMRAYMAMLTAETSRGSMTSNSHEVLTLWAQVCSASVLLGGVLKGHALEASTVVVLSILAALLVVLRRRYLPAHREDRMLFGLAAVGAFGMIATYHRDHDAIFVMQPLLLWMVLTLRDALRRRRWVGVLGPVAVAAVLLIQWVPFGITPQSGPGNYFDTRQAAAGSFLLLITLMLIMLLQATGLRRFERK